ncbi:hypothetical protein IHE45_20G013000 [Dioscorea alata]|uniref:Uncharacterized protein n=1 Tax=Dioscorea alata TaxID=55571 RepID=A0ACB7TVG8_DIOAL|nr:hypothetical protein IHE45_20G013000 [Dioscorea alata]
MCHFFPPRRRAAPGGSRCPRGGSGRPWRFPRRLWGHVLPPPPLPAPPRRRRRWGAREDGAARRRAGGRGDARARARPPTLTPPRPRPALPRVLGSSACLRRVSTMILPQVHLRKPCYDFSFL